MYIYILSRQINVVHATKWKKNNSTYNTYTCTRLGSMCRISLWWYPMYSTLFNNLKGVHYKLLTNNLKNNMLLMLLKYLAAILEIFRFHFKCIATVNTFNNRTLYSYISINKMFMFLIKADKNKQTEHRWQNPKVQKHQAIDTCCVEEKIMNRYKYVTSANSCKAVKCITSLNPHI